MNKDSIQRLELADLLLQYDYKTFTLLCRNIGDGRKLWIRKIEDGGYILNVMEDKEKIYITLESGEKSGQVLVLKKTDGSTCWFIPGKAFMFRLFMDSGFLIFVDENDNFFLIKVSSDDGKKLWHHCVNDGLSEYIINQEEIILKYVDENIEVLSNSTGLSLR
jgi:hypothetical protein